MISDLAAIVLAAGRPNIPQLGDVYAISHGETRAMELRRREDVMHERIRVVDRRIILLVAITLAALVPSQASATPPDSASCAQNAPVVVTTGTGTIGGATCSIEVQCVTQPCTIEVTGSADGVGTLGARIYVNFSLRTACGPAVLGCQTTMYIPGPGPVRVACDSGSSPSAAVAVTVRCSARAL